MFIRTAEGTSFDMQISKVSTSRNSDSVALRSSKAICILNKHCQFIFLQVVCKPHFEKHGPRDLGVEEVGRWEWLECLKR